MRRDCLALEPAPSSCSVARRWLTEHLAGYPDDAVETAVLLTSELVANGVLHAATPMEMVVAAEGDRIRVEVADCSPSMPVIRGYGEMAATGRGLPLVQSLSTEWGVERRPPGKVVFFELRLDLAKVVFLNFPLPALRRLGEQYDALAREFRLVLDQSPGARDGVPGRLLALAGELQARYGSFLDTSHAEVAAAVERGDETVDVVYVLPPDAGPAALAYDALLDEADEYCRLGELLTLAPSPETVALRKWFLGQVADQLDGKPPTPF